MLNALSLVMSQLAEESSFVVILQDEVRVAEYLEKPDKLSRSPASSGRLPKAPNRYLGEEMKVVVLHVLQNRLLQVRVEGLVVV